jgi:PAS domain S-box-containing protein
VTLAETPRDELFAQLQSLLDKAGTEKREHERLVHDLQVHQLELELQNRELREAQSALEASRNRFVELYDFAPIAYFTFDTHGCIEEVNLTGATLIGRERAQLIGAPFAALVELADPEQFWAHLRRCIERRAPVVTELALTVRGTAVQLRAVSSPVADPAGQTVALRTAFIDVTDRYRAELARNAAYESERGLRHELEILDQAKAALAGSLATASEHSLSAILQIIVDQARSIAHADYAALGIGTLPGTSFATWVHSGMDPRQVEAIGPPPRIVGTLAAVIHEARTLRMEDLSAHPAFVGFPADHPPMRSFLGVPISFGDKAVGNLYLTGKHGGEEFSADDQRMVESLARYVGAIMEIARLGDEARDAVRSRDNVLATVSHDLRSPLSAIAISSRLLQRMLVAEEEATARRQAETIGRAADRMSRLIDDLVTASTIEAGRLTVIPHRSRIEQIVAEAIEMFTFVAADNGLAIDAQVPSGLPEVLCDHDRVHQVLANLVGNATKFTPAGGQITIEVARHGDEVWVSVVDTGPGISADTQPHIFERYWKEERASGRRGAGLGLFISKGIVDSHGGRIWVEGTVGTGARFTFSLPVAT